jgi:hypothetical protein
MLRFPDGDVEYRSTRGELPIGALVRSRGSQWRVRRYESGAAILEEVEAPGAPGGPVVTHSPLGDEPVTLEVLAEV